MRTLSDLAVHQNEEPVLLADRNYRLGIRTIDPLQIDSRQSQKPMLLTKYSRQLQEAYHA